MLRQGLHVQCGQHPAPWGSGRANLACPEAAPRSEDGVEQVWGDHDLREVDGGAQVSSASKQGKKSLDKGF